MNTAEEDTVIFQSVCLALLPLLPTCLPSLFLLLKWASPGVLWGNPLRRGLERKDLYLGHTSCPWLGGAAAPETLLSTHAAFRQWVPRDLSLVAWPVSAQHTRSLGVRSTSLFLSSGSPPLRFVSLLKSIFPFPVLPLCVGQQKMSVCSQSPPVDALIWLQCAPSLVSPKCLLPFKTDQG